MIESKVTTMSTFRNLINSPFLAILVAILFIALVVPTLFYNIKSDLRLIPYFSLDEGYGRDLAWYYYSGQKLETFQYSLDYGVEYQLIVDLLARPIGLFVKLNPNGLLLIMRIFHFICGILALIFLWKLTKRHFSGFLFPSIMTIGLVISPSFLWWLDHVKPEPFLMLLLILSFDYTLRILEDNSWKNLILAIAFSAAAFMVKLIGLFLLPGVIITLFLSGLIKDNSLNRQQILKALKKIGKGILLVLIFILIALTIVIPIGSKIYLQNKSKFSDLEQFQNNFEPTPDMILFLLLAVGLLVAIYIFVLLWLRKKKASSLILKQVNILPIFLLVSAIIGYHWSLNLFEWVITYARWLHQQQTAPLNLFQSSNILQSVNFLIMNGKGWFLTILQIDAVGLISLTLLLAYFIAEIVFKPWLVPHEKIRCLKRLILICFCICFLGFLILFQSRFASHHIIILNIIFLLLGLEGLHIFRLKYKKGTAFKLILIFYVASLLIIFYQRTCLTIIWRINKIKQRYDVVYLIDRWWKQHYPYDTKIVADAPYYIYIPSEFNYVVFVQPRLFKDLSFKTNSDNLKQVISKEKPKLIFYNEGTRGGDTPPVLTELLKNYKNIKLKEIMEFNGEHFEHQRFTGDRFVVYEVTK
jgi:hypothetical protein